MRSERRMSYQQKQIKRLVERIKSLEDENKALMKENASLLKVNEAHKQVLENMAAEHKKVMDTLTQSIKEANEIKAKYVDIVRDAADMKKQYANKTRDLLQRLNRQKI